MEYISTCRVVLVCVFTLIMSFHCFAQVQREPKILADEDRKEEACETLIAEQRNSVDEIHIAPPRRLSLSSGKKLIKPELRGLLGTINDSELLAYRFKGPKRKALVIRTTRVGPPLSKDSVQDWFIQIGNNAITFRSIATNPNLLFWDKEGRLNFFTLLFRDRTTKDSLSNLVFLDFEQVRLLDNGETELIQEEKGVPCISRVGKTK